jgi:hypothetical protein
MTDLNFASLKVMIEDQKAITKVIVVTDNKVTGSLSP